MVDHLENHRTRLGRTPPRARRARSRRRPRPRTRSAPALGRRDWAPAAQGQEHHAVPGLEQQMARDRLGRQGQADLFVLVVDPNERQLPRRWLLLQGAVSRSLGACRAFPSENFASSMRSRLAARVVISGVTITYAWSSLRTRSQRWGTLAFLVLRRSRHQPLTLRPTLGERRRLRAVRRGQPDRKG